MKENSFIFADPCQDMDEDQEDKYWDEQYQLQKKEYY